MSKVKRYTEIIYFILDKKHNIEYANIDDQSVITYIKKLDIISKLEDELPTKYEIEYYYIIIDKVNLNGKIHYLVILIKFFRCSNCSGMLTDEVTGLYNRKYWEQIINNNGSLDPKIKNSSLIMIDIDNLKGLNDMYGHTVGDKAIKILGQGIKKCIRKSDIGLRYGGDEFIILLFNQDKNVAYKVIERIKRETSKLAAEHGLKIQISAGIATCNSLEEIENAFKIADKDLYKEKRVKKQLLGDKDSGIDKEIEKLRDKLNELVIKNNNEEIKEEVLKVSQKLDDLILEYLKDK